MAPEEVKFIHLRDHCYMRSTGKGFVSGIVEPRGGVTIAYITNGWKVSYAWAECHEKDNFRKAVGRTKSAGKLDSKQAIEFSFVHPPLTNSQVVSWLIEKYYEYKEQFVPEIRLYRY